MRLGTSLKNTSIQLLIEYIDKQNIFANAMNAWNYNERTKNSIQYIINGMAGGSWEINLTLYIKIGFTC